MEKKSWKKLADSTTVHGVKEVIEAPSIFTLMFWIIIMLCCIGGLIYETYYVLNTYLEAPVATNTKIESLDAFPPVIICPVNWINRSKAAEFGADADVLRYI